MKSWNEGKKFRAKRLTILVGAFSKLDILQQRLGLSKDIL